MGTAAAKTDDQKTIETLNASLTKALREKEEAEKHLREAGETITGLTIERDKTLEENANLREFVARADATTYTLDRCLRSDQSPDVMSRFDGLLDQDDPRAIFHERLDCTDMNGWDLSQVFAWCLGSVCRGFGYAAPQVRIDDPSHPCFGRLNDMRMRSPDPKDQGRMVYQPVFGLPSFDKRCQIEVMVAIKPPEE